MSRKVTKPQQAGSSRSLDRWQREVSWCLNHFCECEASRPVWNRLVRLLKSMEKAERR